MCICLIMFCYSLLFAFQQSLARNKHWLFWVLYIVIISSLNVQIIKHYIFVSVSIYGEVIKTYTIYKRK